MPGLRICLLILLAILAMPAPAIAQAGSAHMRSTMDLVFDCEEPLKVTNYKVQATFVATLNTDKTAEADLRISGFMLGSDVHFDARLGRSVLSAPGGTAQLHVVGPNKLRGIWSLPNNDLVLDISANGKSCAVALALRLKRGKSQLSMFSGSKFYYCSAGHVVRTTCNAN